MPRGKWLGWNFYGNGNGNGNGNGDGDGDGNGRRRRGGLYDGCLFLRRSAPLTLILREIPRCHEGCQWKFQRIWKIYFLIGSFIATLFVKFPRRYPVRSDPRHLSIYHINKAYVYIRQHMASPLASPFSIFVILCLLLVLFFLLILKYLANRGQKGHRGARVMKAMKWR